MDSDGKRLKLSYDLKGAPASYKGGLHIHVGTNCTQSGGHYFDTDTLEKDPWNGKDTIYKSDDEGKAKDSFKVKAGLSLAEVEGHAVVIHGVDEADKKTRVSCGILMPKGPAPTPTGGETSPAGGEVTAPAGGGEGGEGAFGDESPEITLLDDDEGPGDQAEWEEQTTWNHMWEVEEHAKSV